MSKKYAIVEAEAFIANDRTNDMVLSIHTSFAETKEEANDILLNSIAETVEDDSEIVETEDGEECDYDSINKEVAEILAGGSNGRYCYKCNMRLVKWEVVLID